MDILNAKQAFEAMSSGQAVLCRAVGQLLDFGELSQFPATVFFGADYEFCLAPRFMTIGQLDLEVPECIQGADDLINSAMYYAPNLLDVNRPIEILSTADNVTYLKRLIASKLLHKTADDAIAHARAFITLNGGSLDTIEVEAPAAIESTIAVETAEEKPIKKRTRKAKEAVVEAEPAPKSNPAFTVEDVDAIETDANAIIEKFTTQIANCTTTDAVLSLRPVFFANGHLEREHTQHLCKLTEEKLLKLDPEQYASKTEQLEPDLTTFDESVEYQTLLNDLINRAQKAKTPAEATALTGYTKAWSEIQRKPLIDAIHNRLNALSVDAQPIEQPPSLMVQIQNAPDLTTLDTLEIDVGGRHPDIQPKLMGYIRARRFELENGPSGDAQ